jgi:hypothetical protein
MEERAITEEQKQKRKIWKRHIEECRKSGSTQAEYCRRQKLSAKSFTYWKRRFRDCNMLKPASGPKTPVTFVPVEVQPEIRSAADNSSALVLCRDGYRIEIKEGFKAETLGKVLRTIGEL